MWSSPDDRAEFRERKRQLVPGELGHCPGGQLREVPIPIQGSAWPALKAAFPLSEEAWNQMIAVLNAMKPGLVEPKKD